MEHLPVEVVGNILSRLGVARDVVIASSTCKMWREARKYYLHTLIFISNDWPEIMGVVPSYQKFPCLRRLLLIDATISELDLSYLLTSCPKIEFLTLIDVSVTMADSRVPMELNSPSLKYIFVEGIILNKLCLMADSLEKLQLKDCTLDLFELIGKGTLKILKIENVSDSTSDIFDFYIGECFENLDVVDFSNFTIIWAQFHDIISQAPKLREVRLWDVVFDNTFHEMEKMMTSSVCFSKLTHLSLCYDVRDGALEHCWPRSFQLENVEVLELGWMVISDLFSHWVAGFLETCPRLRKLIIHEIVSEAKTDEERQILARCTSSIVRLMRKYLLVEVQFEYE